VIVAIDGPAGSGKSTVARRLADRLGYRYLDTGSMYRALTWLALERGVALEDGSALAALAAASPIVVRDGFVSIAGEDVSETIRAARVDRTVSTVARHPAVREIMRARQRELAGEGDVVIEGRDIGTIVCPRAEVKVYLVADEAERARRRQSERAGPGEDTASDLRLRDLRDARQMGRAPDAVEIDTTLLTIDEVVARIAGLVDSREGA
jgi:cytidylate kinase